MLSSIVHAARARSSLLSALRRSWRHPPLLHPWVTQWQLAFARSRTVYGFRRMDLWALGGTVVATARVRHASSEVPTWSPLAPHSPGITELGIDGRSASLYKGRPVRHAPSASASRARAEGTNASAVRPSPCLAGAW